MNSPDTGTLEQAELPSFQVAVEYAFDYGEGYPIQRGTEEVIVRASDQSEATRIARRQVYDKWRNNSVGSGLAHIADDYTAVKSCKLCQ